MPRKYQQTNAPLGATTTAIATIDVSDVNVLIIDLENNGSAPIAAFRIFGRINNEAPWRDITPASYAVADGYVVVRPSVTAPNTLAAAAYTQLFLNTSAYQDVQLQASGVGAVLKICATGVE